MGKSILNGDLQLGTYSINGGFEWILKQAMQLMTPEDIFFRFFAGYFGH
jgi:hypothetical protein